jgi:polar amino acid transport system substrate-binding protein
MTPHTWHPLEMIASPIDFLKEGPMGTRPMVRVLIAISAAAVLLSACSSSGGSSAGPSSGAAGSAAVAGGLLDKVMKAGKLVVSTDPNYKPQSFLKSDGTFEGFDIDVANEIGKRLGVQKVEFTTPDWDTITAGSWKGRMDASVGSMTITTDRQKFLDFSTAYYYTPAQMTATTASGITTIDGLAGKTICVGAATTYEDWLNNKLTSVSLGPVAKPPAGAKVFTFKTDQECAQAIAAGRKESEGFLTSSTTVDGAISNKTPIVKVGAPVFTEQLAVALDKNGPSTADFLAKLDQIIADMHKDGTLSAMSTKWFGADLTTPPAP